ncbi:MAG TPA: hypothetical protein VNX29_01900 [Kaistia sp.]|nr:hypothetical protein [Kaistia sp.]
MITALMVLRNAVERARVDLSTEKRAQADLEATFDAIRPAGRVRREVRLSNEDIIDFVVDGVGVEVKIGGSAPAIYRQLRRYAEHEDIRALLLVTSVAMSLPAQILGKDAAIARMGVAWI